MILKVTNASAAKYGSHTAKFIGVREKAPSGKFPNAKPSLAWEFEIISGSYKGSRATRWTPSVVYEGGILDGLLTDMLGRQVENGEEVDPDEFARHTYTIEVEPSPSNPDYTHIKAVALTGKEKEPTREPVQAKTTTPKNDLPTAKPEITAPTIEVAPAQAQPDSEKAALREITVEAPAIVPEEEDSPYKTLSVALWDENAVRYSYADAQRICTEKHFVYDPVQKVWKNADEFFPPF